MIFLFLNKFFFGCIHSAGSGSSPVSARAQGTKDESGTREEKRWTEDTVILYFTLVCDGAHPDSYLHQEPCDNREGWFSSTTSARQCGCTNCTSNAPRKCSKSCARQISKFWPRRNRRECTRRGAPGAKDPTDDESRGHGAELVDRVSGSLSQGISHSHG